jgi:hypothetical protein
VSPRADHRRRDDTHHICAQQNLIGVSRIVSRLEREGPVDTVTVPRVTSGADRAAARRGIAAISVTGVLWATIGICVRLLQDDAHLSSIVILFWRLVLAGLVLATFVGRDGYASLVREARRPARLLLVSVGSIVFQLAYFDAVADVGSPSPRWSPWAWRRSWLWSTRAGECAVRRVGARSPSWGSRWPG